MYTRGYGYVKGGFNWTMPTPKGPSAKPSTSNSSNWGSNPLIILTLLLSAFLALSAAALSLSDYWGRQDLFDPTDMDMEQGTLVPKDSMDTKGVPPAVAFPPQNWYYLADRTVLVVGGHYLDSESEDLYRVARSMVRIGSQVIWATVSPISDTDARLDLRSKLNDSGIQFVTVNPSLEKMKALLWEADLVVSRPHLLGSFLSVSGSEDLGSTPKKCLLLARDLRGHQIQAGHLKYLPAVGALIVPSKAAARYWTGEVEEKLKLDAPPVHVVPPGPTYSALLAANSAVSKKLLRRFVRQSLGVREDAFLVTLVSSDKFSADLFLASFKLACTALKGLRALARVHGLVVFDSGALGAQNDARLLTRAIRLISNVHFVDPKRDFVPYLAASDVIVSFPQDDFEAPIQAMVDGMALGLPILSTESDQLEDVVKNGSNCLVHSTGTVGAHQLANNIKALIVEPELRERLASSGMRLVRSTLSRSRFDGELGRVMIKVVSDFEKKNRKKKKRSHVKMVWEVVR